MGLNMHWSVVDGQTCPSSACNDDAFGATPDRLWVLDGATGISDVRCTDHASDAAWLAQCVSGLLHCAAPGSLVDLLPRVQQDLKLAFAQAIQHGASIGLRDVDMPCACLGLVQAWQGHVEVACAGDIAVVMDHPDGGVSVFTDQDSAPFAAKTIEHWRRLLQEHHTPAKAWPFLRPHIRANRAAVNRTGGYTVIHPTRDWAHRVTIHRVPLQAGTRVLLASDGAWRLVDLFGVHTADTLLEQVAQQHWTASLDLLRKLEQEDADCRRYLRVKPHDDATGLLAVWQGAVA